MASGVDNVEVLTKGDVLEVAKQFTKENTVEVQNYCLNDYSEHKLGFMGSHLQLKITMKRTAKNKPTESHKFFVKALLYNSQVTVDFVKEHDIFKAEFDFLNKIKPLLLENYKDEAWSPICYLAKEDSLVLEDLRVSGFELIKNFLDQTSLLKSGLATVARFHACSIVAEARLTQLRKEPTFLNEYFPNTMKEKFLVEDKSSIDVIEHTKRLVFAIANSLGYNSQKIAEIYKKLYDVVKPSKKYRNVICHGDLWANNLMFNNKEPHQPQCVLVDFQTLRYAPAVLDILQFLYLNTTPNYRKQHERELIEFYATVLEKTVENNDDTKTAITPNFEEVLEAYQDERYFGASVASFYLPFILLDQERMKEMFDGPDGSNDALFSDRTEATFAYMKQNESFRNRIEEVVKELADIADL